MTVPSERTPLLKPQIGFKSGCPQPALLPHTAVDAHRLMAMDVRFRKEFISLRNTETPMPSNGFHVIDVTGGRQAYFHSQARTNRYAPWYYKLVNGVRECFVVWGQANRNGERIFPSDRTVRTSHGNGAIYTRRPVFDESGTLIDHAWELRIVQFQVLTKNPSKPDTLRIELVDRFRGRVYESGDFDPSVDGLHLNPLQQQLAKAAAAGFNEHCREGVDPDTDAWRTWFFYQKGLQTKVEAYYHQDRVWRGWLAELDEVQHACQLGIVLGHYRHMFPEHPPRETEEELRSILSRNPHAKLLAIPAYEGTDGSRDSLLLGAYFRLRPHRREQFEKWMTDYVNLISRTRNYTGD